MCLFWSCVSRRHNDEYFTATQLGLTWPSSGRLVPTCCALAMTLSAQRESLVPRKTDKRAEKNTHTHTKNTGLNFCFQFITGSKTYREVRHKHLFFKTVYRENFWFALHIKFLFNWSFCFQMRSQEDIFLLNSAVFTLIFCLFTETELQR